MSNVNERVDASTTTKNLNIFDNLKNFELKSLI